MKFGMSATSDLRFKEATEAVEKANRLAMRDTVVLVANDAIKESPMVTGNNMRSIKYEASGFDTGVGVVDQRATEGAVYSTSGYGGYLETGTVKMAARPYMKPAADKHYTLEKYTRRIKENLP